MYIIVKVKMTKSATVSSVKYIIWIILICTCFLSKTIKQTKMKKKKFVFFQNVDVGFRWLLFYQVSKLKLHFLEDQGQEIFPNPLLHSTVPFTIQCKYHLSFSFLIGFEDQLLVILESCTLYLFSPFSVVACSKLLPSLKSIIGSWLLANIPRYEKCYLLEADLLYKEW